MRAPSSVAPGSCVSTAPNRSASSRACVDFPDPSPPSNAISTSDARSFHFAGTQRPEHDRAGDHDDDPREPQGESFTGYEEVTAEHRDRAVGEDMRRDVVEQLGRKRAERERDQQAEAHDRVERTEDAASQLVVDVLVEQRESDDV